MIQRVESTTVIQANCHTQTTMPVTTRALLILLLTNLEHVIKNVFMGVPLYPPSPPPPQCLSDPDRENP